MYDSKDLIILDGMIKDSVKVPLTEVYGKFQVELKETGSSLIFSPGINIALLV